MVPILEPDDALYELLTTLPYKQRLWIMLQKLPATVLLIDDVTWDLDLRSLDNFKLTLISLHNAVWYIRYQQRMSALLTRREEARRARQPRSNDSSHQND